MGTLNDKLDKVVESKQNIKTAVKNKGGNITDDTLLSQYDDIINQLEVLTDNMKSYIDKLNNSGGSYEAKLQSANIGILRALTLLNISIDPSQSNSGTVLNIANNLNNRLDNQLVNLENAIVNKGGSVPPNLAPNLSDIISGINSIPKGIDVQIVESFDGSINMSSIYAIDCPFNISSYNNWIIGLRQSVLLVDREGWAVFLGGIYTKGNFSGIVNTNDTLITCSIAPKINGAQIDFEGISGSQGSHSFTDILTGGVYYLIAWNE